MIKATSVDDVISHLDTIIDWSKSRQSRVGYFATLYRNMTKAVKQGIAGNAFANGERMEALDVIFANRYLQSWDAYVNKQKCSNAWCAAFDACNRKDLIVLQHLILGINTHINLDLGIAAAEACRGEEIYNLKADFDKINGVIASLMQRVQDDLAQVWPPLVVLERIANHRQEAVLNFSIDLARKASWQNALILAKAEGKAKEDYIQIMDNAVVCIANRIMSPGLDAQLLLTPVLLTESKNVSEIIDILCQ
ncbi:MAG: DUF5995 family protein [Bacteroidota bacterium]|nr:DUF5995 family protein [Bacteroidota bacterium]